MEVKEILSNRTYDPSYFANLTAFHLGEDLEEEVLSGRCAGGPLALEEVEVWT